MNKRLSALLLAGLLPLCAAESLAATSGQINFTGRVADGTCSITGLDQVIQLKNMSAAEMNAVAHGSRIGYENVYGAVKIENCPAGMTTAHLRFDYDAENNPEYIKMPAGSAPGVALALSSSESSGAGGRVSAPGHVNSLSLTNGSASYTISGAIYRNVSDPDMGTPADTVTEGSYGGVVSLSLSFE